MHPHQDGDFSTASDALAPAASTNDHEGAKSAAAPLKQQQSDPDTVTVSKLSAPGKTTSFESKTVQGQPQEPACPSTTNTDKPRPADPKRKDDNETVAPVTTAPPAASSSLPAGIRPFTQQPPPAAGTIFPLRTVTSAIETHHLVFRKPTWPPEWPDMERTLDILYHEDGLIVVHKPPSFVIDADEWSVQEYLQRAFPQYPLVHLVHQLDYATSGVYVLGLNSRAAGRVCKMFAERMVRKEYVAVVHGWMEKDEYEVTGFIGTEPGNPLRMYIAPDATKGKFADTIVTVRRRGYLLPTALPDATHLSPSPTTPLPVTLVHLHLKTGRRHQLRVHLASLGHPIIGDLTYEPHPPLGTSFLPSEPTHAAYTRERMHLHARYILLPLHSARTREARVWPFDLAAKVEPEFAPWVVCTCEKRSAECMCSEREGVRDANVNRWEAERVEVVKRAVEEERKEWGKRAARMAKREAAKRKRAEEGERVE
ncbi:RNA pseudouridylate synthase domain-containing protein 1 [Allomyces javanicus]|nr:RNA pseudouridylate synthase domain-containing protein 1 [Allomyces javanicus]